MKSIVEIFNAPLNGAHWPIIFPARKTILAMFIFLSGNFIFSQSDVTTDIQNINLSVFEAKNLQIDLSYQVFIDDEVQSQMQGVVKKRGNLVYQQTGNITVIKNEPYCLFIDADHELMVLDPYYPDEKMITRDDILHLNIDSLKKHILATEFSDKGANREYIFTLKKGIYSRIIIEFNIHTFFLKKIEMCKREHFKDENGIHNIKMIILFDRIDNKTNIPDIDFDLSKYVSIDAKKKKAMAVGGYKRYKFNSNIDKTIKFK